MNSNAPEPSEDQVAELARKFWEEEGQPEGRAEEHWTRAKEQLRHGTDDAEADRDFQPAN
jgi:hypothetical protein